MAKQVSAYDVEQIRRLASNYKLTPATLAHRLNPHWIPSPHLMYISSRVARAIMKGNGRIVVSMPPRHGKSELITKYTTTWILELFPELRVALASYGADLSVDFGREVRNIINANKDLLDLRLAKDSSAAHGWKTAQGGGMISVGVDGAFTGKGANVLLIDDYLKGIKEALSKTIRDSIWQWFQTVAFTRLEPGSTIIIIATRWHWDDLIGRILRSPWGKEWEEIKLPALAEPNDPLGRKLGEALFPARYPLTGPNSLQERLDVLGTFFFNALFQQRPENENAKLTNRNWLEIVDSFPPVNELQFVRVWDLAATESGGDYTCGTLMAYHPPTDRVFIFDVIRRQQSPGAIEDLVYRTAVDDGANTAIVIEQEPGSQGKALCEHYAHTILRAYNVTTYPVGGKGGKIAKAQPFLGHTESGRVKLIRGPWNDVYLDEFADFPGGDNDDQVDTSAVGFKHLYDTPAYTATWGRSNEFESNNAVSRYANPNVANHIARRELEQAGDPGQSSGGVVWGR